MDGMIQLTDKEQLARDRVCLPLDNLNSLEEARARVKLLAPYVGMFKVGKEVFVRFGKEVIELVHENNAKVFLDLKFHDIPNQVRGAVQAAAKLGVYMLTIHASGGSEMMQAALEGAKGSDNKPKIVAVTVLTSTDEQTLNSEMQVSGSLNNHVLHLAKLTNQAGLDGIVCSAKDLQHITPHLPSNFMYVTPGIKGPNTQAGSDQKRVMTPGNAIKDGSSILVVGRAITMAENPQQAAYEVLQDMARYL